MKTVFLILLTTVWLASWTGIALGLSAAIHPASPAPNQAIATLEH